jgi:hypothetical protein
MIFGEEYAALSSRLGNLLHPPCYFVPLKPKYPPQNPILEDPYPTFLPPCERTRFIPNTTTGKITVLYILTFILLDRKKEDKNSAPNDSTLHRMIALCNRMIALYTE